MIADLNTLRDLINKPFPCYFTHKYGCPCIFDRILSKPVSRKKMTMNMNGYLSALESLVDSGRYDHRKDFTVVIQPTLLNLQTPKHRPFRGARKQPDLGYFAPDCFHWAQKTHAAGN